MKSYFYINGDINLDTRKEFKLFLKPFLRSKRKTIRIRLRSWGGNSGEGKFIEGFIYYMKRYENCTFIMEGDIAASAAFRIFIRGNERIITKNSIIQPHLPVPNIPNMDQEKIVSEQNSDIKLITTILPKLTREDIITYNDTPLPINFMQEKDVVTDIVSRF